MGDSSYYADEFDDRIMGMQLKKLSVPSLWPTDLTLMRKHVDHTTLGPPSKDISEVVRMRPYNHMSSPPRGHLLLGNRYTDPIRGGYGCLQQ